MIALGCDHGGYPLMKEVIEYLNNAGVPFENFGTFSSEACDYPVFAQLAAKAVADGKCEKGILICGTGIGISIAANKIHGIRAALCGDTFSARACREHNDANMLALGARVIGAGLAIDIVKLFLETSFSNEARHENRVSLLEKI